MNAAFQHPRNDPFSPTYNPGWRNHPNFAWNLGNSPGTQHFTPASTQHFPKGNTTPHNPDQDKRLNVLERGLETIIKASTQTTNMLTQTSSTLNSFMQSTGQMLNSNTQAIARLESQLSQLASAVSEREKEKFPSQPVVNPNNTGCSSSYEAQVNAIHSLRSGRQVDNQVRTPPSQTLDTVQIPSPSPSDESIQQSLPSDDQEPEPEPAFDRFRPVAPFPDRLRSRKHSPQEEKILETFKQVKVNIPLLDVIEQIPSYAKFLKELCTKKRRINVQKKVFLAANISEMLSNPIPLKRKDLGSPIISCIIGNTHIDKALLDLGASVNLLPYSVYQQLGLGILNPTKCTLQLADRSVKVPMGELEDVLIKVGDFIFPVDFVVLETQPVFNPKGQTPVILGRPFLATSNALINCRTGQMKLSFENLTADLNIFNPGDQPNNQPLEINYIQERSEEEEKEEECDLSFEEIFDEELEFLEEADQILRE
uniref:F7F22.15, related n=1 Tax=Asparagus officinalis TaxID=4686 RepID=Q2AA34_ASPOF|nr:F7F22.15, related [Asparagus officinalis]